MKVQIDGHVVGKALGRRKQCLKLDLLDRLISILAALYVSDDFDDFAI